MYLKSIFIDPIFKRRYNPVMKKSQEKNKKPYFLPEIKIERPNNGLSDGSYAVVTSKGSGTIRYNEFIHCRETFHGRPMGKILFSHSSKVTSERIAEFINLFEKKLGHKNITHIAPTNIKKITYIEPAEFWLFKPMRQSLFTALLRAACKYTGNFEKALYSISYTSGTKKAIQRFLDGHTWYSGSGSQWVSSFRNVDVKTIETLLGKKPIPKKKFREFIFELLDKKPEDVKKNLAKKAVTKEDMFEHALSLLKMDSKTLKAALKKARTTDAVIEQEALKELGQNKDEIESQYRRRNFSHAAKSKIRAAKEKEKEDKAVNAVNPERGRRNRRTTSV